MRLKGLQKNWNIKYHSFSSNLQDFVEFKDVRQSILPLTKFLWNKTSGIASMVSISSMHIVSHARQNQSEVRMAQ
jgi:hypothetical protein